jgi:ribosomal RNA small subunit methyltransferase G
VRCIHARAEEAARRPEHRARYDIAVSRAVARLPVLLEYTLPFVRTGGTLLALKGRAYAAEQAEGKRAAEILGGGAISARPVRLPGLDDVRAILAVTKERPTPKGYPRRAGLPERAPLK